MTCSFHRDDAAYLLGALDPDERQRYEAHLRTCRTCTKAMREMAGLPGLLARLTPDEVAAVEGDREQPPPELLDSLLVGVRRDRWVSRLRVGVLAGAAAACIGVAVTSVVLHDGSTPPAPAGVTLQAIGGAPVTATASLTDEAWGTEVTMSCEYDGAMPWKPTYRLVLRDMRGEPYPLSDWNVIPGRAQRVEATTSLKRSDISSIEVQTADGVPVLRGTP